MHAEEGEPRFSLDVFKTCYICLEGNQVSVAAMTIMKLFWGTDYVFSTTAMEADPAGSFSGKVTMQPSTRLFNRFSDDATECTLSLLYPGIHFVTIRMKGTSWPVKSANMEGSLPQAIKQRMKRVQWYRGCWNSECKLNCEQSKTFHYKRHT